MKGVDKLKTAAAYIRVSTDDQLELSPDSQLREIRAFAKAHGYELDEEYVFHDDGISGKTAKHRPGFMTMIATAKKKPKPFDAILVWKFSRFARSREDSIVYKSMLKKLGITVVSVSEPITDDKMSIIVEGLIESMDEYYSANLSEEVKRGMLEKFSRKQAMSAAPYGYRFDSKEKKYYPEPAEAEIIKECFDRFVNKNENVWSIARELNRRGIKTKRGNNIERRTVQYYLTNPVYIGCIRYSVDGGGSRMRYSDDNYLLQENCHEAIIDRRTFEAAQKIFENNKKIYKTERTVSFHEYALKGIVKCSECGRNLTFCTHKEAPRVHCPSYQHAKCTSSSSVKLALLDEALLNDLKAALADEKLTVDFTFNKTDRSDIRRQLESELQKEEKRLERMKEAYANGIDTLEEYKENKASQLERIAQLKQKLDSAEQPLTEKEKQKRTSAMRKKIKTAIDALQSNAISENEKNALLKSFISKASYDSRTKTLTVFYYA